MEDRKKERGSLLRSSALLAVMLAVVLGAVCVTAATSEDVGGSDSGSISYSGTVTGSWAYDSTTTTLTITHTNGVTVFTEYTVDAVPWKDCLSEVTTVVIDGYTAISRNAFYEASNLVSLHSTSNGSYTGGVDLRGLTDTSTLNYAFLGCTSLKYVVIPTTMTTINSFMFQGCTSLEAVFTASDGDAVNYGENDSRKGTLDLSYVRGVGELSFYQCYNLTTATFADSVYLSQHAFRSTGLKSVVLNTLLSSSSTTATKTITLNASVFADCTSLETVEIGAVTTLSSGAFSGCTNLKSFEITDSRYKLVTVSNTVFQNCTSLETVDLSSVASLGNSAFQNCTSLVVEDISSATQIGTNVFQNCTSLKSVDLSSASSIGSSAFSGCAGLTSVVMPSVVTLNNSAFYSCTSLETVEMPTSVTGGTTVRNSVFYGCTALTEIEMPTVTTIGTNSFQYCTALTSATMPNVTALGNYAFDGCSRLTSVSIPSCTTVGTHVFRNCVAMTSANMPLATSLGISSFYSCTELQTAEMPQVVTIGSSAFYNCYSLQEANVPKATSIGIYAFYYCIALVSADLSSVYTSSSTNPGVIGDYAFQRCTALTTLTMPTTGYTSIGIAAFSYATSLGALDMPTLVSLGTSAFLYSGVSSFSAANLTSVGSSAFSNAYRLMSVYLPVAETIGNFAFDGCSALKEIDLPLATSIGTDAFRSCVLLETASIPLATTIGDSAFKSCSVLESVTAYSVVTIGSNAFYSCPNLSRFNSDEDFVCVLPQGLTTMGYLAFSGSPFTEIHFPATFTGDRGTTEGSSLAVIGITGDGTTVDVYFHDITKVDTGGLVLVNVNSRYLVVHSSYSAEQASIVCSSWWRDVRGSTPTYVQEESFQITFEDDGSYLPYDFPTAYSGNITAIDGGKIVLPRMHLTINSSYMVDVEFGASTTSYLVAHDALLVGMSGESVAIYSPRNDAGRIYLATGGASVTILDSIATIIVEEEEEGLVVDGSTTFSNVSYGDTIHIGLAYSTTGAQVSGFVGTVTGGEFSQSTDGTDILVGFYETSFSATYAKGSFRVTWSYGSNQLDTEIEMGEKVLDYAPDLTKNVPVGYTSDDACWVDGNGNIIDDQTEMTAGTKSYTAVYTPVESTVTVIYYKDSVFSQAEFPVTGPYTLTAYANGALSAGTTSGNVVLISSGAAQYLDDGYVFSYYYVSGSSGEFTYASTRGEDITLHMEAEAAEYSIEFVISGPESVTKQTITGLHYADFADGYLVSYPTGVPTDYTLVGATLGSADTTGTVALTLGDDGVVIKQQYLEAFGESLQVTFTYAQDSYVIQLYFNDDAGTVSAASGAVTKDDTTTTITLTNPNSTTRVGYTPSFWSIQDEEDWEVGDVYFAIGTGSGNRIYTYDLIQAILNSPDDLAVVEAAGNRINLQVIWSPNTYTIGVDNGDGTTGSFQLVTDELTDMSELSMTGVVTEMTGKTLTGWRLVPTDSSSSGESVLFITAGSTYTLTPDALRLCLSGSSTSLTAVAVWSDNTYTVTFDAAGASPFQASRYTQYVSYLGDIEIPSHGTATLSYMTFYGWVASNDELTYTINDEGVTIELNSTLAAIGDSNGGSIVIRMNWLDTEYSILLDANGGIGSLTQFTGTFSVGDPLSLPDGSTLTYDGYYFAGWSWSSTATEGYDSGYFDTTWASRANTSTDTVTMYAVWGKLSYDIEYVLNGGASGDYAPESAWYGVSVTISHPVRTGYTFAGWTATNLTTGAMESIGSEFVSWTGSSASTSTVFRDLNSERGTVVFTAKWEKATYYVQYNLNGGDGTQPEMGTGTVGDSFTFASGTGFAREGYTFAGWSLDGESVISNGGTFTQSMAMAADDSRIVTLYAVWSPQSYTIEYRYSESDDYISVTAYYDTAVALGTPEMIGYSFAGWTSSDVSSSGARYSNDGIVWYVWPSGSAANGSYVMNLTGTSGATVHLTATWTAKEYKVVYNLNGGTADAPTDSNVYVVGDDFEMADYSVYQGTNGNKLIVGWSLDSAATVALSVDEFVEGMAQQADIANRVTLYAVWVEGSYRVSVDLDGATPSYVPGGWTLGTDGLYYRDADYGTLTRDVMADWDNVVLSKDGYTFAAWSYTVGTVVTNLTVKATFDVVHQWYIYALAAAIAAVVAYAVVVARRE